MLLLGDRGPAGCLIDVRVGDRLALHPDLLALDGHRPGHVLGHDVLTQSHTPGFAPSLSDPKLLPGTRHRLVGVGAAHVMARPANVVHIATGLLLLLGVARHALAKTVLIVFGVAYAAVSVIGLVDGKDVFGLFPIDRADNVLHIVLAALALLVAFVSTRDRIDARGRSTRERPRAGAVRAESSAR